MTTWICIASGPSLTVEDVRAAEATDLPLVVTNETYRRMVRTDYHLYGADPSWWRLPKDPPIPPTVHCWSHGTHPGCEKFRGSPADECGYNSGQKAIELAASLGARTILLIGYDGSTALGQHEHDRHALRGQAPMGYGVLSRIRNSMWQAREYARRMSLARIINCSRYSEISAFERMPLEDAIRQFASKEDA